MGSLPLKWHFIPYLLRRIASPVAYYEYSPTCSELERNRLVYPNYDSTMAPSSNQINWYILLLWSTYNKLPDLESSEVPLCPESISSGSNNRKVILTVQLRAEFQKIGLIFSIDENMMDKEGHLGHCAIQFELSTCKRQ